MSQADDDTRPYRRCVGVMLINGDGHVFVGNRIDTPGEHWQMPQGGIDKGEEPRDAALRELEEETGTDAAKVIAESAHWHAYDIPAPISRRLWKGRFRGQTQRWFLLRFLGSDSDIDLNRHQPEFAQWRWAPARTLVDNIVPFKRDIYRKVVDEFLPLIEGS